MTHPQTPAAIAASTVERIAHLLTATEAVRFRCGVEIDLTDGEITAERIRGAHVRAVHRLWSRMTGYKSRPSADDWSRLVEVDRILGTGTLPAPTQREALAAARHRVAVAEGRLVGTPSSGDRLARRRELHEARCALALLSR